MNDPMSEAMSVAIGCRVATDGISGIHYYSAPVAAGDPCLCGRRTYDHPSRVEATGTPGVFNVYPTPRRIPDPDAPPA